MIAGEKAGVNNPETVDLQLTPRGHLCLVTLADAPALPQPIRIELAKAFALTTGHGLLYLGSVQVGTVLPPPFGWWRDFAARFVTAVCANVEGVDTAVSVPGEQLLSTLIADAPPMAGAELGTAVPSRRTMPLGRSGATTSTILRLGMSMFTEVSWRGARGAAGATGAATTAKAGTEPAATGTGAAH